MGLSFVVFWRSSHILLLENRPRFFIFSKEVMNLIRGRRLIEFLRLRPRNRLTARRTVCPFADIMFFVSPMLTSLRFFLSF